MVLLKHILMKNNFRDYLIGWILILFTLTLSYICWDYFNKNDQPETIPGRLVKILFNTTKENQNDSQENEEYKILVSKLLSNKSLSSIESNRFHEMNRELLKSNGVNYFTDNINKSTRTTQSRSLPCR